MSMRRTYKSKKETGGGIDHRDIFLSVDSTTSVFDAYYIQNIKQVKREMSCFDSSNAYTAASNRVRKRKYVKRLKEPVAIKESISKSTYLTPDKSIHVNRGHDLFDQLLNSSTNELTPKNSHNSMQKLLQPRQVKKTYYRKKQTKTNYSSSGSTDSDKENSSGNESYDFNNSSDIKAHKLVIEKETKSSEIHLEESINNIVKNLPVLRKLTKDSSYESEDRMKKIGIQVNVSNTPTAQSSPQCSTPFIEKYRGKSIYKFSPIKIGFMDESKVLQSIDLHCTSEINNVTNNNLVCEQNNHSPKSNFESSKIVNKELEFKKSTENLHNLQENKNSEVFQKTIYDSFHKDQSVLNESSLLHTTELEPFFGFPTNNSAQYADSVNCPDDDNLVDSTPKTDDEVLNNEHKLSNVSANTSEITQVHLHSDSETGTCDKENSDDTSLMSDSVNNESLYDTCDNDSITEESASEDDDPKEPIVIMERMNDSIFHQYYKKMANYSLSTGDDNNSIDNNINNTSSLHDASNCDSFSEPVSPNNVSFDPSDTEINTDNQLLNRDSSNSENENSDSNEIEIVEENFLSFVTTRRKNDITNNSFFLNLDSSHSSSSPTLNKTVLSNNIENLDKTDIGLDKTMVNKSIQNETSKDLKIMDKVSEPVYDLAEVSLITLEDDQKCSELIRESICTSIEKETSKDLIIMDKISEPVCDLAEVSLITLEDDQKCSELIRESICTSSQIHSNESSLKNGIVLKPGKKWERSLSIYRRMTTLGDTFDQTILDDDSLKTKGRNYRCSVISIMEMQEKNQGSLHNESVFSRRSTFTSKPSRPSIKIFKDPNASNISLSSSVLYDDLQGFLNGDCDDTIIELSNLSIGDSHEVTVLDNFHDTSNRIVTARDYVLRRCNQTDPILFDECYPDTVLKNCRKIGEGVYGEVFLWRAGDGRARVMKIVPIAGATRVNGESQKDFHEVISEIVIAMELSALRAPIEGIERQLDDGKEVDALDLQSVQHATDVFNEVLAVRCVYGAYPSRLLDLWELYDETRGSENDNPAVLPADQLYLVLELANAGQDLESYQFTNAEQACALFKQIALGLAVAEEESQFEHRDLHWGNVLIAPTDQKFATFVLRGRLYRTARCGVAATVIDYSLSRAARNGRALYNDLADDEALFGAVGDYQFEVYRLMRDKLGNDWKNYEPYTNILWLHYTVDKMITALRYTRTNTKIHKNYIAKLKQIKNRILDYGSATQFVLTDNEF